MKGNNILKTNRTFNMRAPAIRVGGGPDILLVVQHYYYYYYYYCYYHYYQRLILLLLQLLYIHKERIRIYAISARGLMKIHPPHAPGKKSKNVTGINFADLFFFPRLFFIIHSLYFDFICYLSRSPNFFLTSRR